MLPKLTIITAFAGAASALLVAPNSPCEQYCGNTLSSTTGSDMVCNDDGYAGTLAGTVFETCIKCELTSAYTSGNTSDLDYLLYNLRYQISYCLFGQQNNTNFEDSPCLTSPACGPLENAFDWKNMSTSVGPYDFCQSWIEVQVPKCEACLVAGDDFFTRNYVTILDAACAQMPDAGSTLSITGTPFSTTPMNITTPSQTPLYTYTPPNEAISLGGKVGIAIGGLVVVLSIAGFLIVFFGRRRRRAFLKSIETRHGKSGAGGMFGPHGSPNGGNGMWPSPMVGGPHTDTPMSQRPLRGWDDQSPVSAIADSVHSGHVGNENGLFPRYFSPYSSQYNSPVSAAGSPPNVSWPTMEAMARMHSVGSPVDGQPGPSGLQQKQKTVGNAYTQEEIERAAHERQLAHIGIAMGGSDPSLRSKNSNMSIAAAEKAAEAAAEAAGAFAPGSGSGSRQLVNLTPPQNAFQPASTHGLSAASSLSSLSVSAGVLWERPGKAKLINIASPTVYTADESSPGGSGSGGSSSESYELREVGSASKSPQISSEAKAPVLQHPGYGRGSMQYYPPPPPPQMSDPYENMNMTDSYPYYGSQQLPQLPQAPLQGPSGWSTRRDAKRSDGM